MKKKLSHRLTYFLFCLLIYFSLYGSCLGIDVTLQWEANTETNLDGYNVYYKPNVCCDPYEFTTSVSPTTNPTKEITDLDGTRPHFFVVTAYTDTGEESGYSNEVSTKAPQITALPTVVHLTSNTATIEWTTDQRGNSEIRYGTSPDPWNSADPSIVTDDAYVNQHSLTIEGLTADTLYYFQVGSTNELGIIPDAYSSTYDNNPYATRNFRTDPEAGPDEEPPQLIVYPYATGISDNGALIKWTTDEPVTSTVEYGLTSSYGLTRTVSQYNIEHDFILSGLSSSSLYHYRVICVDSAGNAFTSGDFTFHTTSTSDEEPPEYVSPPTVTSVTNNTAVIEWITNEPSNSIIQHGTIPRWWVTDWSAITYPEYVIHHRMTLSGLQGDTLYYYRVGCEDPYGNGPTISTEYTFKTKSDPDVVAPQIIGVPTVISISDTTATIVWDTDEPGVSQIQYGKVADGNRDWGEYEWSSENAQMVSNHTMTVTGLEPMTAYYFRVGSTDLAGNGPTTSGSDNNPSTEASFTTASAKDETAPQIVIPPSITAKSFNSVTIEWSTDEPSNSIVQYGLESNIWNDYELTYFDPQGVTEHIIIVSGLSPETQYYFRVGGTDAFNNGPSQSDSDNNPSAEISIITDPEPDIAPPQIIAPPTVTAKTNSVAVIEWQTDEPSNSIVRYDMSSGDWEDYALIVNDADMTTNHQVTLTALSADTTYYFRVGSLDRSGNGPEVSHEVTFKTYNNADEAAPRITVPPTVTAITDASATIEWETDEPSNSTVKYGKSSFLWENTNIEIASSSAMSIRHSITLTNLNAPDLCEHGGCTIYYMVASTDAAGNGPDPGDTESNNPFTIDSFNTEIDRDESAPKIISGPTVTATDNQSAIIEWETDEPSNSIVKYGIEANTWDGFSFGYADTIIDCREGEDGEQECFTTDVNNPGNTSDAELVTQHRVVVTGLQPSTNYFYRVASTDALGNGPELNQDATNPSVLGDFMTAEGPDEVAPSIADLRVFFVTNTTALITWKTDEPSNSTIQYEADTSNWGSYQFEESDVGLNMNHSVTITGLQPDTLYYFRAGSTDANGNGPWLNEDTQESNPSDEMTFRSADGPDVTAPQISDVSITTTGDQIAVVEWTTDEPGNSQVRYDTQSRSWLTYQYGENDAEMVTKHSVTITGLSPSTLYYIRVSSTDASGNNYDSNLNDKNPSIEYNTLTSDADPPSIIVYPDADYPRIDSVNNTIDITYDEPNMQNAKLESNYIFSPDLTFIDPGNSIKEIRSSEEGSTYRLSFLDVPEHTIFTLTVWEEITDADGYRVEPSTILINDNDDDGLPDDWEIAVGLDPTSADTNTGQGRDGDLDDDGFTNYEEFINQTNPTDDTSFPSPADIVDIMPHDGAGVNDSHRVPNNTSFAVLIFDSMGIDITIVDNVTFTIDDDVNDPYERDLGDTDVIRVVKLLSSEADTQVKKFWVVYDRSLDQYGVFDFNAEVKVTVAVANKNLQYTEGISNFKIESQYENIYANDPQNLPDFTLIAEGDPDLADTQHTYDTGYIVNTDDDLQNAKIIFHSSELLKPAFGTLYDLIGFDVTDAVAVGQAISLQPPNVFSIPVKLIIPTPGYGDTSNIHIYLYDGENWVMGCNADASDYKEGWYVSGSRENRRGSVAIKVYHFSGVQAAITHSAAEGSDSGGLLEPDVTSCFIEKAFD